ncbi:5-oxoprolinase subunit B family protein [Paramicrobacterium chengjingii]|uniref:5-oxoprolinase subunit B family protein n=1 Tax=Paramicrobacterium chengjingii TaxID=2769067 RepID=UPI0014201DF7|nr:carboxyltransferase domain-containing protein [Microbacterium chengjingii]
MTATVHIPLTVESYGDSAVMVSVTDDDQRVRRSAIVDLRERLLARRPHGVCDVVAGLESLLIEFDPITTSAIHIEYVVHLLAEMPPAGAVPENAARRHFDIPVVFDDETGPDLAEVADELGIGVPELVERICASRFTISLLAAAMAPMMDGLDVPRAVRRRREPRTNVPQGSIMIAGENAIIQPFPGPTGWRVIGRTPHTIVDIARESPVSFAPGDTVTFTSVSAADARRIDGEFLVAANG